MGLINKIVEAGDQTDSNVDIIPLNTIDSFKSISLSGPGTDIIVDLYLYKIVQDITAEEEAAGINRIVENIYILNSYNLYAGQTLILSTDDFAFNNAIWSLRAYVNGTLYSIVQMEEATYAPEAPQPIQVGSQYNVPVQNVDMGQSQYVTNSYEASGRNDIPASETTQ
tara:strand:+ start:427 stop:930 length:504 start_codon:yes stop_codon:yes gene_type:complete